MVKLTFERYAMNRNGGHRVGDEGRDKQARNRIASAVSAAESEGGAAMA